METNNFKDDEQLTIIPDDTDMGGVKSAHNFIGEIGNVTVTKNGRVYLNNRMIGQYDSGNIVMRRDENKHMYHKYHAWCINQSLLALHFGQIIIETERQKTYKISKYKIQKLVVDYACELNFGQEKQYIIPLELWDFYAGTVMEPGQLIPKSLPLRVK